MSRHYEKTVRIALLGLELAALSLVFYLVWVEYYNPHIVWPFWRRGNYLLTIMYGVLLLMSVLRMKGQGLGEARLTEVVVSQCIALLLTTVIVYVPMSLLQYELLNPTPLALLMLGQWAIVVVWNYGANRIYYRLVRPRRVLLVTDGTRGRRIAAKLNRIPQRYRVQEEATVAEGKQTLLQRVRGYDAVLVSVENEAWCGWLSRLCFENDIEFLLVPTLADMLVNSAKEMHMVDTPLLGSTGHRLTVEARALKRMLDVTGALLLLVLCSPLFVAAAVAIKICDGGPVFFRQERLTRNGEVFKMLKFRSMREDAEMAGQRLATENDARITPVGRVLRKYRIDELPQFLNVLRGEMSLVGPRPECPAIAAEYEKELPEFAYRLKVKAGITGYAQVYGDYATEPVDKLLMDIMYIEKSSLMLDLNLVLLTLRTLFLTDKTKGAQQEDIRIHKDTQPDDSQVA